MIPWQAAGRTPRRRVALRRAAVVCLSAPWFLPLPVEGMASVELRAAPVSTAGLNAVQVRPGPPELAGHAIRIVTGRIHIVSSDPLGRLERWELAGAIEGMLYSAAPALAHPARDGRGVWRWAADYGEGRYVSAGGRS